MIPKRTLIFLTAWIIVLLSSCGPSQTDLDVTATKLAVDKFATQTADAPTRTQTLAPTSTPTPTITPTPRPPLISKRGIQISDLGIISIGIGDSDIYPEYFPMFFQDGKGYGGFEIDLATEIVQRLFGEELTIEWIPLTLNERFDVVQKNNIDFLIFLTTHTPSREKLVLFSSNYFLHDLRDPLAIAVSRFDPIFRDEIDRVLLEIIDDGTWQTIYDDWYPNPPAWTIEEMLAEPPWGN